MRRDAFHEDKGERRLRLIEPRHMAVAGHSQFDYREFRYLHETDLSDRSDDVRDRRRREVARRCPIRRY